MKKCIMFCVALLSAVSAICQVSFAQNKEDLAKQLSNPIAALISVPVQTNYDSGIGEDDGSVWRVNIQPVIPFSLSEDWNMVSRTILPVLVQQDIPVNGSGESGLGDTVQSLFLSPTQPTSGGLIWGGGAVFLLPTATDDALGGKKWGAGPTAVGLLQQGPWTFGMLANHIVSFAGDDARADVNATFVQPFFAYITQTQTTFSMTSETTYDWEAEQWSVPLIGTVGQLLTVGKQTFQLIGGVRYWAESPDAGPEGWGGRLQVTFLFPK